MAMLGLCFCARAFSSCGEQGPLFIAVRGPLTVAASLVAEHRLRTCRLSNCGSRAQLLRGLWDLPRPGLEPASPALAGGLSTTAPPGKPYLCSIDLLSSIPKPQPNLSLSLPLFFISYWGENPQQQLLLFSFFHLLSSPLFDTTFLSSIPFLPLPFSLSRSFFFFVASLRYNSYTLKFTFKVHSVMVF